MSDDEDDDISDADLTAIRQGIALNVFFDSAEARKQDLLSGQTEAETRGTGAVLQTASSAPATEATSPLVESNLSLT